MTRKAEATTIPDASAHGCQWESLRFFTMPARRRGHDDFLTTSLIFFRQ
jgi:hypothetical protein